MRVKASSLPAGGASRVKTTSRPTGNRSHFLLLRIVDRDSHEEGTGSGQKTLSRIGQHELIPPTTSTRGTDR